MHKLLTSQTRLVLLLLVGFTVKIASAQLYEADTSSGRVLEFTPAGVESTFASELSAPVGVAFDASGNLFVTASSSGQISKFTPAGAETAFATGLSQPMGLAFDAFGNLFVGTSTGAAGAGEILKFTPSGVESTFASGLSHSGLLAFAPFTTLHSFDGADGGFPSAVQRVTRSLRSPQQAR